MYPNPLNGLDPIPDPPEEDTERRLLTDFEQRLADQWHDFMGQILDVSRAGKMPLRRTMRLTMDLTRGFHGLRAHVAVAGAASLDEEDEYAPAAQGIYPMPRGTVRRGGAAVDAVQDVIGHLGGMADTHELTALSRLAESANPEIRRRAEARVLALLRDQNGEVAPTPSSNDHRVTEHALGVGVLPDPPRATYAVEDPTLRSRTR